MKRLLLSVFILSSFLASAQVRQLPNDTSVTTQHKTLIKGQSVSYQAEIGMQPLWDEQENEVGGLCYTYYTRTDVKNREQRPLLISFNGGPGSASVWMHIAYTGPKILNIDDEGYPVQPYGIKSNPYSILDIADIVFVNPVNTGYSRLSEKDPKKVPRDKYFGVNADINYLAAWVNTFVSRHNRWLSPKFLIGESYGGTRVSGLAGALQDQQWMYLNGVILVSPADYLVFESDVPLASALNLPYYAATAWHHKKLSSELQSKSLEEVLAVAEAFAIDELLPALSRGAFIDDNTKERVASAYAKYSGLSQEEILDYNLQVPTQYFWKALLRKDEGLTIGRLDSRYRGLDKYRAGVKPDFNTELSTWLHAFTPAINHYLKNELNFNTDLPYNMFGPVHPWDRSNNNTREQLRKAMAQNPYLKVLYQAGYYDGATTYFNSKYSMWQLDPSGMMKDRLSFKAYKSGHMMYLRSEDLKQANEDLRLFIQSALPKEAAKY